MRLGKYQQTGNRAEEGKGGEQGGKGGLPAALSGKGVAAGGEGPFWDEDLLVRYANTAGPLKGLRRGSMLCEPVLSLSGNVAAVVQVVRSKDQHEAEGNVGFPQPFSTRAKHMLRLFAVLLQGIYGTGSRLLTRSVSLYSSSPF